MVGPGPAILPQCCGHKLSACLHIWLHICWCIHSVVPHLGIVKESILNTNKPGAVFLFFIFSMHICLNMFASTAHHAIQRCHVPFVKINCKSALSMSLIDIVAPVHPGTPGTGQVCQHERNLSVP